MSVSSDLPSRAELLREMLWAGRQMSTSTIMLHQAVADRLGLHPTDHKCADLLHINGPMTAGELADLTGLTTGAITGVIDRLEAADFVRREDDPDDRRRVIVRVVPKSLHRVGRLFQSLAAAMVELCGHYTDRELATILDFMTRSREVARQETLKLRQKGPARTREAKAVRRRLPAGPRRVE